MLGLTSFPIVLFRPGSFIIIAAPAESYLQRTVTEVFFATAAAGAIFPPPAAGGVADVKLPSCNSYI